MIYTLELINNCKIMTVAELIEKLKELPQDYVVTIPIACGEGSTTITEVYNYGEPFNEIELT